MKKKIFIVLVNFNNSSDSIECLESLFKQDYDNYQILLVDNSPIDKYYNELVSWASGKKEFSIKTNFSELVYPLCKKPMLYKNIYETDLDKGLYDEKLLIVKLKENKGFAAANNIALKYIQKQIGIDAIVWLLNNDTVVTSNAVRLLSESLDKMDSNVVYGTPLVDYDEPQKIQAIGGIYNRFFGITTNAGSGKLYTERINVNDYKTDYPVGASLLIHSNFLNNIGLMNEAYFLYFEELDWVQRAKIKGGGHKIINAFIVFHKQGSTTKLKKGQKNPITDSIAQKSKLVYAYNYNRNNIISIKLFMGTVLVLFRLFKGNFKVIPNIYKLIFNSFGR